MRATTTRGVLKEFEHETEDTYYVFRLEYEITPGERMIWRTPNGDGYPGSPDECEILAATCTTLVDERTDWTPNGPESRSVGQWFLGQIEADNQLRERVERACFEDAAERFGDDDRF